MKTLKLLTTMAILGLAILPLTGCGEDGATEPTVAAEELYKVTVTLDEFYVVGDCDDIIQGFGGEFDYGVWVRASGESWNMVADKKLTGKKGESYKVSASKSLTLDAIDPKSIEIWFQATETDWVLFSDDVPDDRMDDRYKINVHAYKGNGDWDLGAHSITLGNDNGCKVRLDYTLRSVKIDS